MCRVSTLGTLRYSFLQPFARPSLCRATNFMRQTFTLLWRQALANPERDPVFAWILDEPTTVAIVHLPSKLETVECRLRDPTWVRQKDKPTSGPDRPERLLTTDHPPDIQAGPRQMAFYGGPRLKGNLQAALRALCPQSAILRGTQRIHFEIRIRRSLPYPRNREAYPQIRLSLPLPRSSVNDPAA